MCTMSRATADVPVVFVVDDDDSVRQSMDLLIRAAGWRPESFASAEELLAPSCLILDVNLPGFNGLDLQRRVAIDRPAMPIIFTSLRLTLRRQ